MNQVFNKMTSLQEKKALIISLLIISLALCSDLTVYADENRTQNTQESESYWTDPYAYNIEQAIKLESDVHAKALLRQNSGNQ